MDVKTTLDIPNDLYRQAKAQAALQNRRIKDLVTDGLRLAISQSASVKKKPMEVLAEIRKNPLHRPGKVSQMIDQANRLRKEGWNRSDRKQ